MLEEVNHKPFKKLKGTRAQWFESLDKPVLGALPLHAYEYTDINIVKVNIDYHIQYDDHLGYQLKTGQRAISEMERLLPLFQKQCEEQAGTTSRKAVVAMDETFF